MCWGNNGIIPELRKLTALWARKMSILTPTLKDCYRRKIKMNFELLNWLCEGIKKQSRSCLSSHVDPSRIPSAGVARSQRLALRFVSQLCQPSLHNPESPARSSGDSPAAATAQKQTAVIGRGRACGKPVVDLSRDTVIDRTALRARNRLPCSRNNNCASLFLISEGENFQKICQCSRIPS